MWVGGCIRECVCRGAAHIRLCYAISVLHSDELAWLAERSYTYMRILNDAPGRPSGSTVNGVSHHRIICGWDGMVDRGAGRFRQIVCNYTMRPGMLTQSPQFGINFLLTGWSAATRISEK